MLAVLMVILVAVVAFFGYRFVNQMVEQYTVHHAARASQGRDAGREASGAQGSSRGIPQGRRGGNADRAPRLDQRRPQRPDRGKPRIQGDDLRQDRGRRGQGASQHPTRCSGPAGMVRRPLLEWRSRSQGVAPGRRLDRHARLDRGQRPAAARAVHDRDCGSKTWPRTSTRTKRPPR